MLCQDYDRICREDKQLILSLYYSNNYDKKRQWLKYCFTAWETPEIRDLCIRNGISKEGFCMIACGLIKNSQATELAIVVNDKPMLISTLFFLDPAKLLTVITAINSACGDEWSKDIDKMQENEVKNLLGTVTAECEPFVFRHLIYLADLENLQKVAKIEQAKKLIRKWSIVLVVVIAISLLIILFSR
jgi:hypothetical protein